MRILPAIRSAALAALLIVPAGIQAQEPVDVATIQRIKTEATDRSQVMDIMSWLTDVHGPRLTGSPITKAAGDWAMTTMKSWGLQNVHEETWGPFGRGWTADRVSANIIAPHPFAMIAYVGAWSTGTNGPVAGPVVRVTIDSMADFARYKGKLRGAWVIMTDPVELEPHFDPLASRLSDERLEQMAAATPPEPRSGNRTYRRRPAGAMEVARARTQFLVDEGALGVLQSGRGSDGTVFVSATGSRAVDAPAVGPHHRPGRRALRQDRPDGGAGGAGAGRDRRRGDLLQ